MHPFKILTLYPINTKLVIFIQLNFEFVLGGNVCTSKKWRGNVLGGNVYRGMVWGGNVWHSDLST